MRLALVHLEISTRAGCQAHLALVHLSGHLLQRLRRFGFMFSLLDGAVYEDIEGFRHVFDRAMYLRYQTSSVLSKAPQFPDSQVHLLQVRCMLACYPLVSFALQVPKRDRPFDKVLVYLLLLQTKLIDGPRHYSLVLVTLLFKALHASRE
jgi:hypothetical protein